MLQIFDRIAPFAPRHIEHEEKQATARDVPEKCVAQTEIPMRSFDQSRNVRHRRAAIIRRNSPRQSSDARW